MSKPPNIVIFMPDQMRWDCTSHSGNRLLAMPHFDALAEEGAVFSNFYVNNTVCTPSRCAMFTGHYPHNRGHRSLWYLLQEHEPNVLRDLKQAGYHVHLTGKNHLLADEAVESSISSRTLSPLGVERHNLMNPPDWLDERYRYTLYYGERPADLARDFDRDWVDGALEFLGSNPPEPFCLVITLFFPHPPYWVEEPYYSMYDRDAVPQPRPARDGGSPIYHREIAERYGVADLSEEELREIVAVYYGMCSRIDDQFGEVCGALRGAGVYDETAIVYLSDHGDYCGDWQLTEKWPSGFEDPLANIPFAIKAPGVAGGQQFDQLAEAVDLTATLQDLAGIESGHDHFGLSLMPLLAGERDWHKQAVYCEGGHLPHETQALEITSKYSSLLCYHQKAAIQTENRPSVCKSVMVRSGKWKFVMRLSDLDELYDLEADPREMVNLAQNPDHAAIVRELTDRIARWYIETGDYVPREKDEAGRPAH